jgi:hypothetical protein
MRGGYHESPEGYARYRTGIEWYPYGMPGVCLEIVGAKRDENRVLDLAGERFVLGRSEQCAVALDAEVCSRQHALVEFSAGTWFVRDLRSRNGTYLNGRLVESAPLRALDLIELGQAGARVRIVSMEPEPGLTAATTPAPPRPVPPPAEADPGEEAAEPVPEEAPAEPSRPEPRPRMEVSAKSVRPAAAWTWTIPILGLALGGATALHLWDHLFLTFPYAEVTAPVSWAMGGLAQMMPELDGEPGFWVECAICLLWFGGIGLAFQRPLRRWYAVVTVVAVQTAAVLLYR